MVKIRGEHIPNELVGVEEPTPYIHALFSYTRKMDAERAKMEVKKAHEVSYPVDALYERIKSVSLFPSVFMAKKGLRNFPKVRADNMDAEGYVKKPSKRERRDGELMY